MCDGDRFSPIYRPDKFYPLPFGTVVMLLGATGPIENPFYFVDYVEPFAGLNKHGTSVLWTHSGAAPAGYELDPNATSGQLNANGGQTVVTPNIFSLGQTELVQFRFSLRPVVWAAGANVADDIDLQVALPQAINRWTLLNARGRVNMMNQPAMLGDSNKGPAQAANIGAAQTQPVAPPWDAAHWTELFVYQQTNPSFTFINNGATASAAGDALGIYVWGYDYKVTPLKESDQPGPWTLQRVPGRSAPMMAPAHFVTIPINGQGK